VPLLLKASQSFSIQAKSLQSGIVCVVTDSRSEHLFKLKLLRRIVHVAAVSGRTKARPERNASNIGHLLFFLF
jgi:ornithine cyclodeaminase/alanine dehydrogenase-like protein (mu-crystallin family)